MPYKDPEAQKAAQKRQYERNRERYLEGQRRRRAQPGYRDVENAKRRAKAVVERQVAPLPRAERVPAARTDPSRPTPAARRPPQPESPPREVKRTPQQQAEHEQAEQYAQAQREMKQRALARLGAKTPAG